MSIARQSRLLSPAEPPREQTVEHGARCVVKGLRRAPVSVFGPPAGRDGYFERNAQLLRTRIADAKQDRNAARRAGEHRRAEVLQECIDGWQQSLRDVGQ